jgi:hypothetical protein
MDRSSRWIAGITAAALFLTSIPSVYGREEGVGAPPTAALVGLRTGDTEFEARSRKRLTQELGSSGRFQLISDATTGKTVEEQLWAEDKIEAIASLEQANKNFLEGRRLYGQLALEEAIKALTSAVEGYRKGIEALRSNRDLLLSHLYLGIALIILGKEHEPEGKKYIREMVVLDPLRKEQKLSPRDFSPKILNIHKAITEDVLRGSLGQLVVNTKPAGATVILDGVVQAKPAPVTINEVPVGEHFVVVEKRGYRQWSRRVVVGTGSNPPLSASLTEWQPFAPYSPSRRTDLAGLEILGQVASKLGAQVLVLAQSTRMSNSEISITAQLFDVRTREFSRIERVETVSGKADTASQDVAQRLLRNLTPDGMVATESSAGASAVAREEVVPIVEPPAKYPSERTAITKKWWFWTAIAVVVVGGGLGAFLLLGRKDAAFNVLNVNNPLPAQ